MGHVQICPKISIFTNSYKQLKYPYLESHLLPYCAVYMKECTKQPNKYQDTCKNKSMLQ